jgi:hypothetical protein
VEGPDKFSNLFASVFVPAAPMTTTANGPAPPAEDESLAELLLKAGFAKVRVATRLNRNRVQLCSSRFKALSTLAQKSKA